MLLHVSMNVRMVMNRPTNLMFIPRTDTLPPQSQLHQFLLEQIYGGLKDEETPSVATLLLIFQPYSEKCTAC